MSQVVRFEQLSKEELVKYIEGTFMFSITMKVRLSANHWEYRANETTNKFLRFSEEEQLDAVEQYVLFTNLENARKEYDVRVMRITAPRTNLDGQLLANESTWEARQRGLLACLLDEIARL
jgi:hypothetical protein